MNFKTLFVAGLFFQVSFSAMALPVNINVADAPTLAKSLNGVGEKKAEAIVQYRNANGSFQKIVDLLKVKGIGESLLEKNKQDLFLDDAGLK